MIAIQFTRGPVTARYPGGLTVGVEDGRFLPIGDTDRGLLKWLRVLEGELNPLSYYPNRDYALAKLAVYYIPGFVEDPPPPDEPPPGELRVY